MTKRKKKPVEKIKLHENPKTTKDSDFCKEKCKKVPEVYRKMFELKSLNIDEFWIFETPGDGLCGAHCLIIHTTLDEGRELAMVLRREINLKKMTYWDTYKADYAFDEEVPHEEIVGMKTTHFKNEDEYIEFVRRSKKAETMWMTQSDLQVAADIYGTTIHNLETAVPRARLREGATEMEQEGWRVRARWTEIKPLDALAYAKDYKEEVGEIYLINSSQSHFNLLIHKESELAKKGTLKYWESNDKAKQEIERETEISVKKTNENKKETSKANDELYDDHIHCIKDDKNCLANNKGVRAEMDKMKKELNKLKNDYEEVNKILANETDKRSKAEDMYKDLKLLRETEKKINQVNNQDKVVEKSTPNKTGDLKENTLEENSKEENGEDESNKTYDKELFTEVVKKSKNTKKAEKPKVNSEEKSNETDEGSATIQPVSCKCNKCPKEYETMDKVRRHEFRAHKIVDCFHCGQKIRNRVELQKHKQNEHRMMKVPECKYFQEGKCLDGEECLYDHQKRILNQHPHEEQAQPLFHKQQVESRSQKYSQCRNGPSCNDQDHFGPSGHLIKSEVKCRFQETCYKETCPFKHTVQREAFLEVGAKTRQRN